jgi:hypothetical protein
MKVRCTLLDPSTFSMQLGFNDFLTRCEILDFDLDGKMVSQGKMTIRDITRMKVRTCSLATCHTVVIFCEFDD